MASHGEMTEKRNYVNLSSRLSRFLTVLNYCKISNQVQRVMQANLYLQNLPVQKMSFTMKDPFKDLSKQKFSTDGMAPKLKNISSLLNYACFNKPFQVRLICVSVFNNFADALLATVRQGCEFAVRKGMKVAVESWTEEQCLTIEEGITG